MILDPLQGELLMDSQGCLRIKERLIIWPYGFSANIEDGIIEIIDSEGKSAMRVGDYAKLAGADNTPAFFAEEKLGHPLPKWCEGPYFLMHKISDIPTEPQSDRSIQQNPDMIIAEGYAKRYGVSINETLLRLELQNSFPQLEPQLESNESATFGGIWIQHEPEYRIVVAFTRDGEKTIARYSDYIPTKTAPYIEVREVDKSLASLVYDQNILLSSLHEQGIEAGSRIDVVNNCVSIDISRQDEAKFKSAEQDGKLAIPEKLTVNFLEN